MTILTTFGHPFVHGTLEYSHIYSPDCGEPVHVPNANVSYEHPTIYLATANYTCDTGYYMNGSSSIMCTSDGNWEAHPNCTIFGETMCNKMVL